MTNQDFEDQDSEPMTGWDSPEDYEAAFDRTQPGLGSQLLRALGAFLSDPAPPAHRDNLLTVMHQIDWNALDFALNALEHGEDLFSCYPNNDVLVRYQPRRTSDTRQYPLPDC